MLAAATRLQDTAVALFPVFLFFFLAFGGFIVRLPTLPGYLGSWAPPISFIRWAMEVRCVAVRAWCGLLLCLYGSPVFDGDLDFVNHEGRFDSIFK